MGKGCYYDEHELYNPRTEEARAFPSWEWADVDRGRLVWTEGGKLFASRVKKAGLGAISELYDFNAMGFERIQAPY